MISSRTILSPGRPLLGPAGQRNLDLLLVSPLITAGHHFVLLVSTGPHLLDETLPCQESGSFFAGTPRDCGLEARGPHPLHAGNAPLTASRGYKAAKGGRKGPPGGAAGRLEGHHNAFNFKGLQIACRSGGRDQEASISGWTIRRVETGRRASGLPLRLLEPPVLEQLCHDRTPRGNDAAETACRHADPGQKDYTPDTPKDLLTPPPRGWTITGRSVEKWSISSGS
jgi:hypothetical protein